MRRADLLENFTPAIESLKMIPSGGGLFEVLAGDTLVFSKKAEGRHAEEGEVLNPLLGSHRLGTGSA